MKQRDKLLKNFSQENDPTKKTTLHTAYKQLSHFIILHTLRKIVKNPLRYGKEYGI